MRVVAMMIVVFLSLTSSAQAAADHPAPTEAKALAAEGKEAFRRGDYDLAARAWQKAYALKPLPALLFNLAQALRMAGRLDECRDAYTRFLAQLPLPGDRNGLPGEDEVRRKLAEVEALLAARASPESSAPPAPRSPTPGSSGSAPAMQTTSSANATQPSSATAAAISTQTSIATTASNAAQTPPASIAAPANVPASPIAARMPQQPPRAARPLAGAAPSPAVTPSAFQQPAPPESSGPSLGTLALYAGAGVAALVAGATWLQAAATEESAGKVHGVEAQQRLDQADQSRRLAGGFGIAAAALGVAAITVTLVF